MKKNIDALYHHTKKRMYQRFNININKCDYDEMCERIRNANFIQYEKRTEHIINITNKRSIWRIEYNGYKIYCVYGKELSAIHTVLKDEWIKKPRFQIIYNETTHYVCHKIFQLYGITVFPFELVNVINKIKNNFKYKIDDNFENKKTDDPTFIVKLSQSRAVWYVKFNDVGVYLLYANKKKCFIDVFDTNFLSSRINDVPVSVILRF